VKDSQLVSVVVIKMRCAAGFIQTGTCMSCCWIFCLIQSIFICY